MIIKRISHLATITCVKQLCKYGGAHQISRSLSTSFNLTDIREDLVQLKGGSVDLDLDGQSGIAVITLNNPEKMNAISGQMMIELADCVGELETWSGRGVILRGAKSTFCSGGDLTTVENILKPVQGQCMSFYMQDTTTRFSNLPLISFALIQGRALGGGAELPMSCDFRFMTESAKLGFVQSRMGVTPGWGGGTRLVNLIGRTKALKLLCSGRVLGSNEADRLGLVDNVLEESEEVLEQAKGLITKFYCSADSSVLRAMKRVTSVACDTSLHGGLLNELEVFGTVWAGESHLNAMNKKPKHD